MYYIRASLSEPHTSAYSRTISLHACTYSICAYPPNIRCFAHVRSQVPQAYFKWLHFTGEDNSWFELASIAN